MTREELIQSPEYWRTLYENECERLGIKPILTFLSPIDEEELDKMAEYYLYGENSRCMSPREIYELASPQDKDVWDAYKAGRKEIVV